MLKGIGSHHPNSSKTLLELFDATSALLSIESQTHTYLPRLPTQHASSNPQQTRSLLPETMINYFTIHARQEIMLDTKMFFVSDHQLCESLPMYHLCEQEPNKHSVE